MSSNPSPLPPVSPSASLLSAATARLPIAIEKARAVIDSNLALLRAILRDSHPSSMSSTDGRFVSARDSLRALHLEIEDRWFDSQLEVGNGNGNGLAAAPKSPRAAARSPRGPRKVSGSAPGALGSGALGSSPLSDYLPTNPDADPQSAAAPGPARSSLLTIAGIPVAVSPPLSPSAADPLGTDDIPEMPVASGISSPTVSAITPADRATSADVRAAMLGRK